MRFLKKILVFIIFGTLSFIVAACYGAPMGYYEKDEKIQEDSFLDTSKLEVEETAKLEIPEIDEAVPE